MSNTYTLGNQAEYVDTKGHAKLAMVIAVPGQIKEGTSLPALEDGFYNVLVFSPSGSVYTRRAVPEQAAAEKSAEHKGEDGTLHNYIRPMSDFAAQAASDQANADADL